MKLKDSILTSWLCVLWMHYIVSAQEIEHHPAKLFGSNVSPVSTSESGRPSPYGSIASCFATACHGSSSADGPVWSRSARDWMSKDPHRGAYSTLQAEMSRQIVRKLSRGKLNSSAPTLYEDFLEKNCTSCHATQQNPSEQRDLGVDCQSCHGPSAAWGEDHWKRDWNQRGPGRYQGTEMLDTQSLDSRIEGCATCHVGDLSASESPREVNHDLLAAGHPPLHFEFESYWRRLPPHWDVNRDARVHGEMAEFRRWRIGQLVQAASRIRLLANRAEQSIREKDVNRPWPELAEYSCYDCHHELSHPSWRQERKGGASDAFNWDPWTLAELKTACTGPPGPDVMRAVAELGTQMQSRHSTAALVREPALMTIELLTRELDDAVTAKPASRTELLRKLQSLLQSGPKRMDWESAQQWQAAARALAGSLKLDASKRELAALEASVLRRAEKQNNRWIDSPIDFNPQSFEQSRKRLLQKFELEQQP